MDKSNLQQKLKGAIAKIKQAIKGMPNGTKKDSLLKELEEQSFKVGREIANATDEKQLKPEQLDQLDRLFNEKMNGTEVADGKGKAPKGG